MRAGVERLTDDDGFTKSRQVFCAHGDLVVARDALQRVIDKQRAIRSHQHPPEGIDQARLRIPQPRRADSHGTADPRRSLPATTRPRRVKPHPRKRR